MNLIEKLGGYEKAKQILISCEFHGRKDLRVPVAGGFIHIVVDFLEKDLLDYRKEHNIFEVGDKVVSRHKNLHLFDDVVLDIAYFRDDLKELGRFVRFTNGNDFKLDALRHATDAEIKANRRLRVLESDDCSDIQNHISPNTIVLEI